MNLFYPSHDIALANGIRHFNPPKAALRLQEDLAWVEDIFAPDGSQPWGWDWDTREYLAKERHVKRSLLPTDDQLEQLRQLSSRRTLIDLLQGLHYRGKMPEYLTSEEEVLRYLEQNDAQGNHFVLKTPWSSSGRGLIRSSVTPRESMIRQAHVAIQKMGGIMGEPWLDKKQDFALLFYVHRDHISFLGYSYFENDTNGTYRQGFLLSNADIERRLTTGSPLTLDTLLQVRQDAIQFLTECFSPFFGLPWEVGYVGIDMMTLPDPQQPWACCELNLRCTMGVVARLWADRHLEAGQSGRFFISPMTEDGHFHAEFVIDSPCPE